MRPFNENDYQLVKRYEKDFTKAIESRYCTGLLQAELEVCQKIYNETLNRQANLSCGGCVLQMMTSVGRLYFSYKENRVEPEPQNTAVMHMMTIVEEPKPDPIVEVTGVITELNDTIKEATEKVTELNDAIENIPQEIVTELIQDEKIEGNDNSEEPVDVLFQDEKPKKERRQRKSKTNEDKVDNQAGEDNPAAL